MESMIVMMEVMKRIVVRINHKMSFSLFLYFKYYIVFHTVILKRQNIIMKVAVIKGGMLNANH